MKAKGKKGWVRGFLLPVTLAFLTTAAVSLLFAGLMNRGLVPDELVRSARMISVAIGAAAAGALSYGSGKHGLLIGALLAVIWSAWRIAINSSSFLVIDTWTEMVLCILFSWAGSCIFHKKKRGYTKRNRKAAPAR